MDYVKARNSYVSKIDGRLASILDGKSHPPAIYESIAYSLLSKGKRLRPVLLLGACEAAIPPDTGDASHEVVKAFRLACSLDFACAVEMIHTYSLIHDDLPILDNDDLRRGVPTNHKVYGDAVALLAGDALLNMSYELMIDNSIKYQYLRCLPAMAEVARAAGINGMIGGQVMDVYTEGTRVDEATLHYIHENKTAALIRASVAAGAIIGGAEGAGLEKYRLAASNMGLAFQIMDDILDVTGSEADLGKPIGSDARNAKNTYVSIFGLERAKRDYFNLWDNCIVQFDELGARFLTNLAKDLRDRVN